MNLTVHAFAHVSLIPASAFRSFISNTSDSTTTITTIHNTTTTTTTTTMVNVLLPVPRKLKDLVN